MLKHFALDIELNFKKYSYISLTFLFGVVLGIFVLYFSKKDNLSDVSSLMTGLFLSLDEGNISSFNILTKTVSSHIKTLIIFLFANIMDASLFIVTVMCVMSGYIVGNSFCALFMLYGLKSVFIILFAIIPAKIFTVCAYALMFASSLDNSDRFCESRNLSGYRRFGQTQAFSNKFFVIALLICLGALADSFFTPLVLKLFMGMFL